MLGRLNGHSEEMITGYKSIVAYNKQGDVIDEFNKTSNELTKVSIKAEILGGSMGPIYGTIFMEMSDKADDADDITLELFGEMLEAGLEGLYGIVDARPGDKTLVDTLFPACECIKAAAAAGKDYAEALDEMKEKAEAGKETTKDLVAKYGRAARLGERSRGVLDAGATSCCIILQAMADGMKSVLEA